MKRKTKVLITGGAGFIGSHLSNKLSESDFDVLVVDNLSKGKRSNINTNVTLVKQDIRSKKFISTIQTFKPDFLFHLAAQTNILKSQQDPRAEFNVNFLPIIEILKIAKKTNLKKIILSSSAAVYGESSVVPIKEDFQVNPNSPYGVAKLATENYIKYFSLVNKLPYVVLRYSNVYGPKQDFTSEGGVVAIFTVGMLKGKNVTIYGSGKQTRDFIYVDDVVSANIKSLKENLLGVFNVGTSREVSINDLFKNLKKLTLTKSVANYVEEPSAGVARSALSGNLLKKSVGFKASTDLITGLKNTIDYFRQA